eukprot:1158469-Pelagomonas_calceolata.AAC.4
MEGNTDVCSLYALKWSQAAHSSIHTFYSLQETPGLSSLHASDGPKQQSGRSAPALCPQDFEPHVLIHKCRDHTGASTHLEAQGASPACTSGGVQTQHARLPTSCCSLGTPFAAPSAAHPCHSHPKEAATMTALLEGTLDAAFAAAGASARFLPDSCSPPASSSLLQSPSSSSSSLSSSSSSLAAAAAALSAPSVPAWASATPPSTAAPLVLPASLLMLAGRRWVSISAASKEG